MGERARRKEQKAAERAAAAAAVLEREPVVAGDADPTPRNGFNVVRLRNMDSEERKRLRADVAAEVGPKLSTWRIGTRLARFARPHWKSLLFGLALLVLQGILQLGTVVPLAFAIDSVVKRDGLHGVSNETLAYTAGGVIGLAVGLGLISYLDTFVVTRAGRTMVRDLRAAMFDHVQKLSLQYHARRRSGDLLIRVSGDVNALQSMFTGPLIEIVNSAFFFVGLTVVLVWIDWRIGVLALAFTPLLFIYVKRYSTEIRNFTSAQRKRDGALASLFHEAMGTTRLSRVFNRETAVKSQFETESAASLELGMEASLKEERFTWGLDILGAIQTAIVMVYAVRLTQEGAITPGALFLVFSWVRQYYRPIRTAMKDASKVWRSLAAAERVIEVLDTEHGVTDSANARPAPALQGEIVFHDVAFSYNEDRDFMSGVNLTIPAKRITAVVGPTGAGKTTLVSMVPRLYDPMSGYVTIDGQDIREYTLESLRDQISVVLQESTLLYASVAENIAYGRPNADRAEIETAAWLAGAHDFIMDLPQGYDTIVGERGETLSGGQRQLIAISRAIIRDAPIVILDEPMTGLDASSAAQVRDGLERLMQNKTVLFITHNLALVDGADKIVVIADGAVVQEGTPSELRNADGLFRELYLAQSEDAASLAALR